jgi:hypothetical protein
MKTAMTPILYDATRCSKWRSTARRPIEIYPRTRRSRDLKTCALLLMGRAMADL